MPEFLIVYDRNAEAFLVCDLDFNAQVGDLFDTEEAAQAFVDRLFQEEADKEELAA